MMNQLLSNHIEDIKKLCTFFEIKNMYAFGSVVSNEFNKKSDVDFLISFKDNLSIEKYTNNYFSLHHKLKHILNRNIDLVTEKTLQNPYLIESINKSKVLIYES